MARTPLAHNPLNGVTAGVWREDGVVVKVLTRRRDAPPHWAASDDRRHWNYWRREALVYESGLPEQLRAHSGARPVDWALMRDDGAWSEAVIREHFPASLRAGLVRLHDRREQLLELMERLPRTLCHLDVWERNVVSRDDGEIVLLDWAFAGDGAVGEDAGNLILNAALSPDGLDDLDAGLTDAYLRGLREAGWSGDARTVRLGICASAVKYDWLTAHCLARASAGEPAAYAAHAAALSLCARWADEVERRYPGART